MVTPNGYYSLTNFICHNHLMWPSTRKTKLCVIELKDRSVSGRVNVFEAIPASLHCMSLFMLSKIEIVRSLDFLIFSMKVNPVGLLILIKFCLLSLHGLNEHQHSKYSISAG